MSLALIPLPGANHIEIADEFYKRFEDIKKNLPEGLDVYIGLRSYCLCSSGGQGCAGNTGYSLALGGTHSFHIL